MLLIEKLLLEFN